MMVNGIVSDKKAQFFLLAAVIISAIVISLGITSNVAIVSNEPDNFYDFSYEVDREAGAVIDYQIYTDDDIEGDLSQFVDMLAGETKESNPDANFLFIYGNNENMEVRNYGTWDVEITDLLDGDIEIPGVEYENGEVCNEYGCWPISIDNLAHNNITLTEYDMGDNENIIIEIKKYPFKFPISEYRQIIFIMQKDVDGEVYVTT